MLDKASVKNILAVRNDRFGEFLLNIPAFRALKESFPSARLIAVVDPYLKELAQSVPAIDEIIEWDNRRHSLSEKLSLLALLKKKKIDIALVLNPSREFHVLTFLAGVPVRAGYDRKCGFLLTDKIKDRKHLGEKHEVEYNLELVSLAGADTRDKSLSLKADSHIPDEFGLAGKDFIALHPFTSDPVKQWPLEYFSLLARRITEELGQQAVIVGSREGQGSGYFKGDKIINLTGKTSLGQLASVLKKSRLLISGDSGPVHLACAVNTPVLAIFRNDLAGKTAKRWGPWGEGHKVIEKAGLEKVSPEEVFALAKTMLRGGKERI